MKPENTRRSTWPCIRFGDVVQLYQERSADPAADGIDRYVGIEHIEPEDMRIRSWGLVEEGTTFTQRFEPGHVLFAKRRAYQRKVAVAEFSGVCSGDIYVLEPKNDRLLSELLPFICQTDAFFAHAVNTSAGSLSPRTDWKQLSQYQFALPPLAEQHRIAQALRCSGHLLETIQTALSRLSRLRQSALDTLCASCTGREVRLQEIGSMQNGSAFPSSQYQETGVRLLRPGNLGAKGYVEWVGEKTVCLPEMFADEAADYLLEQGDVVINLTAQSLEDGFMGRVCLVQHGDRSLLNQRIGRFVFDRQQVIPEFVFRILQTSRFQQHAVSMCEGTKVKHLYWRHLQSFQFMLPCLSDQQDIAGKLRQVDGAVELLEARERRQWRTHVALLGFTLDPRGSSSPQ